MTKVRLKHIGNSHPPRRGENTHFGSHFPKPRATHSKPIAGQTDKKTGYSALSRVDHDSQRHEPPAGGHWKETASGYSRGAHHGEIIKNSK